MYGILYKKSNGFKVDILSGRKSPALVKNKKPVPASTELLLTGAKPNKTGLSYETFTIVFFHLERSLQSKVLKVSRGYRNPIYKIVLSTAIQGNGSSCWLEKQSQTWSLSLGNGIDKKLIAAICSAIECQEPQYDHARVIDGTF
jgi:hypothetical protein